MNQNVAKKIAKTPLTKRSLWSYSARRKIQVLLTAPAAVSAMVAGKQRIIPYTTTTAAIANTAERGKRDMRIHVSISFLWQVSLNVCELVYKQIYLI